MKCPLRVSYWGESRESNCHPDCAWRMSEGGSKSYCAVAAIASNLVYSHVYMPMNAELSESDGE